MKKSLPHYAVHNEFSIKGFCGPDYRFLSNFQQSEIIFCGLVFPTVENAYQALKCAVPEERRKFLLITPAEAKQLGKTVQKRADWSLIKLMVMADLVFRKFEQNLDLRRKLIDTGTKYLEESNNWSDTYWGVYNDKGENKLGKILMDVRQFFSKY